MLYSFPHNLKHGYKSVNLKVHTAAHFILYIGQVKPTRKELSRYKVVRHG